MECEHCKKTFKNVNLHITKAHKRDMWKFIIPKKYTDEADVKLYSFGKKISSEKCGSEGCEMVEYIFGIPKETSPHKAECISIQIKINDNNDLFIEGTKVCYFIGKEGHIIDVDKLNYTIEYEQ